MVNTNACIAMDGRRVVCDYGVIDRLKGETAEAAGQRAYVRWLEEGWEHGGYKPMTREEFEAEHPALKSFQDFK